MNGKEWRALFVRTRGLFWCLFPSCEATREMNIKITFSERIHSSLLQFMHYHISYTCTTWWAYKRRLKSRFSHIDIGPHLVYLRFWWCRHNWLCSSGDDVIIGIFDVCALDIYFIHSDIYGRSCKNVWNGWQIETHLRDLGNDGHAAHIYFFRTMQDCCKHMDVIFLESVCTLTKISLNVLIVLVSRYLFRQLFWHNSCVTRHHLNQCGCSLMAPYCLGFQKWRQLRRLWSILIKKLT